MELSAAGEHVFAVETIEKKRIRKDTVAHQIHHRAPQSTIGLHRPRQDSHRALQAKKGHIRDLGITGHHRDP
ncbi:hypothetical protein AOLI_G00326430 [Acnodon oligacanthus]